MRQKKKRPAFLCFRLGDENGDRYGVCAPLKICYELVLLASLVRFAGRPNGLPGAREISPSTFIQWIDTGYSGNSGRQPCNDLRLACRACQMQAKCCAAGPSVSLGLYFQVELQYLCTQACTKASVKPQGKV